MTGPRTYRHGCEGLSVSGEKEAMGKGFAGHLADIQQERETLIHAVEKAVEYQLLNKDSVVEIDERKMAEGIVGYLESKGLI